MDYFEYKSSTVLEDVFSLLEDDQHKTAVLAGGTDIVNHIRLGKRTPAQVVDIKNIKELNNTIEYSEDGLTIGALATLTEVEFHPVIRKVFRALSESANRVGSRQIRNRGTVVGNICNASPAADTIPALLIYDAIVNIIGRGSRRSVPLESFITGPGKIDLNKGELVESIYLPVPPKDHTSCYLKLARREGADLTTVGVSALISKSGEVRMALGAVGPKPFRAYAAEGLLSFEQRSETVMESALEEAKKQASPISDLRGSKEYRLAMVKVYIRKALDLCERRLKEEQLQS
jgi:CO/xanthine dehydrogenase FAD-binding subunit